MLHVGQGGASVSPMGYYGVALVIFEPFLAIKHACNFSVIVFTLYLSVY